MDLICVLHCRVWRIDSGSYEDIAELIVSAWETRCAQLREGAGSAAGSAGAPPDSAGISIDLPRPILMHSNLGSVEEVLQVCTRRSHAQLHDSLLHCEKCSTRGLHLQRTLCAMFM